MQHAAAKQYDRHRRLSAAFNFLLSALIIIDQGVAADKDGIMHRAVRQYIFTAVSPVIHLLRPVIQRKLAFVCTFTAFKRDIRLAAHQMIEERAGTAVLLRCSACITANFKEALQYFASAHFRIKIFLSGRGYSETALM